MDVPLRGVDRRDHEVVAGPVLELVHDLERETELRLHLLLPLGDEGGGGEDEDLPRESPHDELLQDDPRLDRLPEAHLVGEDRPPSHLPQHPEGGVHLVVVVPHAADQGNGQEEVEAGLQPEEAGLVVQHPVRGVLDDAVADLHQDVRVVRGERQAGDPGRLVGEGREVLGSGSLCHGRGGRRGGLRNLPRSGVVGFEDGEAAAGLAVAAIALRLPQVRSDQSRQEGPDP